MSAARPRRADGTLTPAPRVPEPPSPLLDGLRFIARAAVRRVYNDPRTTTHVERLVLRWLLQWDPLTDQGIRQYIAFKSANEARRIKAMSPAGRTAAFARSVDGPVLTIRRHGAVRTVQG